MRRAGSLGALILLGGAIAVGPALGQPSSATTAPGRSATMVTIADHARSVPAVIRPLVGQDVTLVARLHRPEGVWEAWEDVRKDDTFDYIVQPGRAPQQFAGGQCLGLRPRAVVSICIWGRMGHDGRFSVVLGRVSGRAATLEARTARGDAVDLVRGRQSVFLAVSLRARPVTWIVARNARQKVIARVRVRAG